MPFGLVELTLILRETDATQNNMVKQFSKDAEESAEEQQNRVT
jgi:hypothetical protein